MSWNINIQKCGYILSVHTAFFLFINMIMNCMLIEWPFCDLVCVCASAWCMLWGGWYLIRTGSVWNWEGHRQASHSLAPSFLFLDVCFHPESKREKPTQSARAGQLLKHNFIFHPRTYSPGTEFTWIRGHQHHPQMSENTVLFNKQFENSLIRGFISQFSCK